jgi:hypothetical protein
MRRYEFYITKEIIIIIIIFIIIIIIIIIISYFNNERSVCSISFRAMLCILRILEQKEADTSYGNGIDYQQYPV